MSAHAEKEGPRLRRWLIPLLILVVAGGLLLMLTYEVIYVDVVSFMEDQPSVGYQEPPRRYAPEGAVPIERPAYLDEPATMVNPIPADEVSLQRGALLFSVHCAPCHGPRGRGDGPIVKFWKPDARRPADLSADRFNQYPDSLLYGVITQGVGGMPPLRENMNERQYWDVINYVRSLQP
jgi:mono/diheme cytochrome c family protein